MPSNVFDEKEELPGPLSDQQNECDSLDDDPTWSPEELERAYKARLVCDLGEIYTHTKHATSMSI